MKNALICFLKYPDPGFVKTRLAVDLGRLNAAEIYRVIAERVITELYPLEEEYDLQLWVDPAYDREAYESWIGDTWDLYIQKGKDLGARLAHATETAFNNGFQRAILIGTDCVGMDQTFMTQVIEMLTSTDLVIGPSTDGGYYLLATNEFYPWLFENMPWSTDKVLEETLIRAEARDLRVRQLEARLDVDNLDDLTRLRDALPEEHFLVKKVDQIVLHRVSGPPRPPDHEPND